MRAAVLREIGKPLVIEDVPDPAIGPGDVLVAVQTCGICRTDLHIQDGLAYVPSLPHIPGHEPAGVVVAVGSDVSTVPVGARVVPHLFVCAGECWHTRHGRHAQATHLKGILGVTLPGGFVEYMAVPEQNVMPLPDDVSFDAGGLTSCAVITAVNAFRKVDLEAGDAAVVLGTGGIGLLLVQILRAARVRVTAIDINNDNLQAAKAAGAEVAELMDDAVFEAVRRFAGAERGGVDAVFELVGRTATLAAAASFVRPGGTVVVIGEEAESVGLDSIQIAQREIQIIGSRNGGMQDGHDAIESMQRGIIRPHIAAAFPLDRINEAFDAVRSGRVCGRVVIRVGKEQR